MNRFYLHVRQCLDGVESQVEVATSVESMTRLALWKVGAEIQHSAFWLLLLFLFYYPCLFHSFFGML